MKFYYLHKRTHNSEACQSKVLKRSRFADSVQKWVEEQGDVGWEEGKWVGEGDGWREEGGGGWDGGGREESDEQGRKGSGWEREMGGERREGDDGMEGGRRVVMKRKERGKERGKKQRCEGTSM